MNQKNIRVLVIDDDENLLKSYKYALNVAGIQLETARDAREALSAMAGQTFDVALVDLRLRDQNGIEVARELKKLDPLIQTIIITAFPCYQTAVETMKLGAFDYLSKAAEAESIIETLREAYEHRELQLATMQTADSAGKISMTIICENTIIKRGWLGFAAGTDAFRIQSYFNNIPLFLKSSREGAADIIIICAGCNPVDSQTTTDEILSIRQRLPQSKIVIFNHELEDERMTQLLKLGVYGFFDRDLPEAETERFIKLVHGGETIAPRRVLAKAIDQLSDMYVARESKTAQVSGKNVPPLTDREQEIISCIAKGLKNKEIADILFISPVTVKTHISNIFKKLEVESRLQAVNRAYELNLLI